MGAVKSRFGKQTVYDERCRQLDDELETSVKVWSS